MWLLQVATHVVGGDEAPPARPEGSRTQLEMLKERVLEASAESERLARLLEAKQVCTQWFWQSVYVHIPILNHEVGLSYR